MRRRDLLYGFTTLMLLGSRSEAQKTPTKRIAIISPSEKVADLARDPDSDPFTGELKRLGLIEGQNLIIERYSAEGKRDRYTSLAREVADTRPDAIYSLGSPITLELKAATKEVPIVAFTGDPIRFGIVSNLARPGGNITGISSDAGIEIWGKRLALLAEIVPRMSRVAFVSTVRAWEAAGGQTIRETAQNLGIGVSNIPLGEVRDEAEFRRAIGSIRRGEVDGIAFSEESESHTHRFLIVELVNRIGIPAIYVYRDQVESGGLMSYSYDIKGAGRTNARQVAQILRGAHPGDLPYEQASRFELVLNLKTAKSLGLELSTSLVARADQLIE